MYLGPIGILGIFGNILIIATIFKLEDARNSASGLAVQLLAFWDSMAVLGDAVFEMTFKSILDFNLFTLDSRGVLCKMLKSFDWLGNHSANWHVVIVCLDRYLSVAMPSFYFSRWSQRHIWTLSVVSVLFTWISQIPIIIMFRKGSHDCAIVLDWFSARFVDIFVQVQVYVFYFAIPGVLILGFSAGFIYKLNKSKVSGASLSPERLRVESAFRRMIVSLIISYAIFATGASVFIHLGITEGYAWAYNLGDGSLVMQSSINLLSYIVSGPVFRKALWVTITCG
ncbi:uncharacterized protein LOC142355789 [Convolutriloba macropyga]|uniref:uncharacterized protein LOC142355789 n=1 Tax=Convolutriloba macropyga TaxID=536237 RepID=UPI003F51DDEA